MSNKEEEEEEEQQQQQQQQQQEEEEEEEGSDQVREGVVGLGVVPLQCRVVRWLRCGQQYLLSSARGVFAQQCTRQCTWTVGLCALLSGPLAPLIYRLRCWLYGLWLMV